MLNPFSRYRAYFSVFLLTLVGHALGFGRELATAYYLGATEIADGLIVGLLPLSLYLSVFGTAYAQAAVALIRNLDNVAQIRKTLAPIVIVGLVASAVTYLKADLIIGVIAPGLTPGARSISIALTSATGLCLMCVSLASWAKALRHLEGKFARASFADLLPNIGILLGIAVLYPRWQVNGIAFGAMAGYLAQFLLMVKPDFLKLTWQDVKSVFDRVNLGIYRNTFLAVLSYSVVYVEFVVDRYFASTAGDGTIATMNYAQKLMVQPLYAFFMTASIVVFPRLIKASDGGNIYSAANRLYKLTLLSSIVIFVCGVLFSHPIVSILLGYGALAGSTNEVAELLRIYMFAFIPMAFVLIASKVCYAMGNFRTPLYAGVGAAIVKICASALLFPIYSVKGLIAGTILAACVNSGVLIWGSRIAAVKVEKKETGPLSD